MGLCQSIPKNARVFFYVGPPKEDFFSVHLLCPIFQSSYMLQLQISIWPLKTGFLSLDMWVLMASVSCFMLNLIQTMSDIQLECPSCLGGQASEVLISVVALHGRCETSVGHLLRELWAYTPMTLSSLLILLTIVGFKKYPNPKSSLMKFSYFVCTSHFFQKSSLSEW